MHRKFLVHVYPVRPCVPPRFLSLGFFPGLPNRSTTLTIHSRERESVCRVSKKTRAKTGFTKRQKTKIKNKGNCTTP